MKSKCVHSRKRFLQSLRQEKQPPLHWIQQRAAFYFPEERACALTFGERNWNGRGWSFERNEPLVVTTP
ncbi:hypothetical protein HAX54_043743, partial [Datura stramonium]|nr:hypothetical protein [Datura stramonium]